MKLIILLSPLTVPPACHWLGLVRWQAGFPLAGVRCNPLGLPGRFFLELYLREINLKQQR